MLKKLGLILAFGCVSLFGMHSAEININNEDLEVVGKLDIGQINPAVEPDTMFVGLKLLNAHESHSSIEGEESGSYIDFNFLMMNELPVKGLYIGLGMKLNYSDSFDADFISIPLGIELKYKLPATNLIPLYLSANVYYAPSVLSLSDADNYLEYRINFDIEVIRNGSITLGFRSLDLKYEEPTYSDYSYNRSAYLGFKFRF